MSIAFTTDNGPKTSAEREVIRALHELPNGYQVAYRSAGVVIGQEDRTFLYEPDFVVTDPQGRKIMVEAKAPESMSWMNMGLFVEIDRYARQAGQAFVVLVPGDNVRRRPWTVAEFHEVNVGYGDDIVRAVINAFRDSTIKGELDFPDAGQTVASR